MPGELPRPHPPCSVQRPSPTTAAATARCSALRCPSEHSTAPRLAGEWASTSACRRSSATSSSAPSWPATIDYMLEQLRRPSAPSPAASSSERAPATDWASATGAEAAGGQLGERVVVVGGGVWGGRQHGVDPASGGDRPGMHETSPPSCGARAHGPLFAASARRMLPRVHSTHVSYDVKMLS